MRTIFVKKKILDQMTKNGEKFSPVLVIWSRKFFFNKIVSIDLSSLKLILEKVGIMELSNKQDMKLCLAYQTLQQQKFLKN